jgi:drug/metabolite transporter (DMT)-like permease
MLPMSVTALTALVAHTEHGPRSWDHLRALPVPRWHLYAAKAVCVLGVVAAMSALLALLAYTMPFWAVLLAWWLLGDRPTPRHWLGLALAGLGLLCIIEPWRDMGSASSTMLALAGGVAWAGGTVLSKRMFHRHAPSVLSLTAWQMLLGGVALGMIALAVPERAIEWNLAFTAGLAYSVVLASSLAWWLWSIVLQRLSTTVASVSSLGVPIVSVLLAWLILHEQPSAMELLGIVFVLAGLVAVSGVGRKTRRTS